MRLSHRLLNIAVRYGLPALAALLIQASHAQQQASLPIKAALPQWVDGGVSDDSRLQFVGISGVYLSSDGQAKKHSKDAACNQAIGDIAKFFGVQVQVETIIETSVTGGSVNTNLDERASEKTGLSLFQLKPEATHYEDINQGSHLRAYCLIILNPASKTKIETELEQSKDIYKEQIALLQQALIDNNFAKAEIVAAALKGLPLLSQDGRLPPLLSKLAQLQKNLLAVTMTLNKDQYHIGDDINVSIEVNQHAYLYLLMSDSEGWQIIYPNPVQRINRVNAKKSIELPNARMQSEGFQIRVLDDANQQNSELWAIASAKKIHLNRYSSNYGYYDVLDQQGPWLSLIKSCMAKNHCSDSKQVLKTNNSLSGLSFTINGNSSVEKTLQHKLANELKRLGLKVKKQKPSLSITLSSKERRYFSNMLDIELDEIKLIAKIINNNDSTTHHVSVKKSVPSNSDLNQLKKLLLPKLAKKIKTELYR